jgi:hypothetical protein
MRLAVASTPTSSIHFNFNTRPDDGDSLMLRFGI